MSSMGSKQRKGEHLRNSSSKKSRNQQGFPKMIRGGAELVLLWHVGMQLRVMVVW
jgi:hypothetical protein